MPDPAAIARHLTERLVKAATGVGKAFGNLGFGRKLRSVAEAEDSADVDNARLLGQTDFGEGAGLPDRPHAPDRLANQVQVRQVSQADPLFEPVLEALAREYSERYGDKLLGLGYPGSSPSEVLAHLKRHPAESLEPPHGTMLVLVDRHGRVVASGGIQRFDHETAELKRMWTSEKHRRQGLARKVISELEAAARQHGYQRLYLTTGPAQPEAIALYRAADFSEITDRRGAEARANGLIPFEKPLA
uniref:GNAT family N-acetyltransferase n=1 Tax=Nocardia donostiensis TaxID=1538463 RepID=UPI00111BE4E8|nr:GNAT family N-acetyltransferase [Nocardia donostiensis]